MASKRPHVIQGDTPGKPCEKAKNEDGQFTTSRKCLFGVSSDNISKCKPKPWSDAETAMLVQYICLHWEHAHTNNWPTMKTPKFWEGCAKAINTSCNSDRSGTSCRTRVLKHLSKKFSTLDEAEEKLGIDYVQSNAQAPLSPMFHCSPTSQSDQLPEQGVGDITKIFIEMFPSMSTRLKKQLLLDIFRKVLMDEGGFELLKFVSSDFLELAMNAMKALLELNKHNLILHLAKCFQKVEDTTRMPTSRMPFGLLDYNIRFFSSSNTQMLGQEDHYTKWLETMFSHFGHKWMCLFRGPAWQYEWECEKSGNLLNGECLAATKNDFARCAVDGGGNGPSLNEKGVESPGDQLEIVASALHQSGIVLDDEITDLASTVNNISLQQCDAVTPDDTPDDSPNQFISTLWTHVQTAKESEAYQRFASPQEIEAYHGIVPNRAKYNPQNPGLYDPLKCKVNVACMGVRNLQRKIQTHGFSSNVKIQMEALKQAQKSNPKGRWWLKADACDVREGLRESMCGVWAGDEDLGDGVLQNLFKEYKARISRVKSMNDGNVNELLESVKGDLDWLLNGERGAKASYENALQAKRSAQNTLMELAWDTIGYEQLIKDCKCLTEELSSLISHPESTTSIAGFQSLKKRLLQYLQGLYSKKRSAASHLMVFMISDELRNSKPYAVPVQFLSYKSITDGKVRELEKELENVMTSIGMTVVGFSTDGEFNSLRTRGNERAISVIELIKDAKAQARKTRANVIDSYFKLDQFGQPINNHPAVPVQDVMWLNNEMVQRQLTFHDALLRLRKRLFPNNYDPHHWVEGREETVTEIMKSILAVYLFRKAIEELKASQDPADFSKFMYQPEKNDSTSELVHHREDHNHLLKRIVNCLREGLIPGIDLRFLRRALEDPTTGLTYEALTGKNKQSVPDCERLVSPGVISFLERVGHNSGAKVIKTIHNWHKAVDGRGITERVRGEYTEAMKNWILDDWMPWHNEDPDYSTMDVNRPIKGICGLTREVIVGLVANLESRQLRRVEYTVRHLPPEHPRASSTDDVEGLFALLHELLGPVFDMKQFFQQLPKIMNEFVKRINPELPFYYWTGNNCRYRDCALPSFNVPSGPGIVERLDRVNISRRGDPGVFVANRASLPQRGKLTARAVFHRAPVALPPVNIV